MSLSAGTKLGPYEIQSALGAGGMGEVYRAKDTRLDRTVAIKVLPSRLSSHPDLKERFVREAKSISSLNHPRICTLHDVGQQDGVDFLVMEYLEGETLAERLVRGALPLKEALRIGVEVSEALEVAHRAGIVHRDLKPGNIMLTKNGSKLMDFGLAKAVESEMAASTNAPSLSATRTISGASPLSPLTTVGAVVGTIQYMSPEQIEGRPADARSDIFALGATLYEAMTGRRAFEGKSQISVANAILEKEPEPISTVNPAVLASVDHVIARCLAKDPEQRWQSARDLGIELSWIAGAGAGDLKTQITAPASARGRALAWSVAGLLAVLMVAMGIWWNASRTQLSSMYFSAPLNFVVRDVALAPNGHTVAVVGYNDAAHATGLYVYEVGAQGVRLLADTNGARFPFWSPDSQALGFFAEGELKRMDVTSGAPQILCEAPNGRGGAWGKDGTILFTPSGSLGTGIWRVSASGGTARQLTSPDKSKGEDGHRWPEFLPDGKHFLFLIFNNTGRTEATGIAVGSVDSKEEKHFVVRAMANAEYVAPGYLVFYRDNTLFAQAFDARTFDLKGEPTALLNDLQYNARIQYATFTALGGSVLLAQPRTGAAVSQLTWFDRSGKALGKVGDPEQYGNVTLSADGRWLAVDRTDAASQNTDVWMTDLIQGGTKRLTFDPAIDARPVLNPSASEMVFLTNRALQFEIYTKATDGREQEIPLLAGVPDKYPNDWSHDGKYLLYQHGTDLWYLKFSDKTTKEFLHAGTSVVKAGSFSPDGNWVAYASNESGRWEVYVTSFPAATGKWQISNGGGEQPRWRGDGKELFYISSTGKITAVPVSSGNNFNAGPPVVLFQAEPRELVATSEQIVYDVSRDGQKILVNTAVKSTDTQPATVILNWTEKLKK